MIDTSDEDPDEQVMLKSKNVASPQDSGTYQSLILKETSNANLCKLLAHSDLEKCKIKGKVPWHVTKDATFAIDITTLDNKRDITIDAWKWHLNKTCVTSSNDFASFKKGNDKKVNRAVKRFYRCTDDTSLTKTIFKMYPPGSDATNRLDPFAGCNSIVLVTYHFAEKGKLIPPSKSSRVYPSVKDKLRSELSKGSSHKKATFTVEADAGGIQSAPNKSSLPTRNQSCYVRKTEKLKKRSDDPLKELI